MLLRERFTERRYWRNNLCRSRSAFLIDLMFPARRSAAVPNVPLHSSSALFANRFRRLAGALDR